MRRPTPNRRMSPEMTRHPTRISRRLCPCAPGGGLILGSTRDPETLPRYAYFPQRLAMPYMQRTTGEARSAEEDHGEDTAPC